MSCPQTNKQNNELTNIYKHPIRRRFYEAVQLTYYQQPYNPDFIRLLHKPGVKIWCEIICQCYNSYVQFSKLMVFDAYSAFVNNFSLAMETAKKNARSKHAFAEFLKVCQGHSAQCQMT